MYIYILYAHKVVSLEVQVLLRRGALEIGASRHFRGLGLLASLGLGSTGWLWCIFGVGCGFDSGRGTMEIPA